jgi:hypothetical protein
VHNDFQTVALRAIRAAGGFANLRRSEVVAIVEAECVRYMSARRVQNDACVRSRVVGGSASAAMQSPERLQYYYDALNDLIDDALSVQAFQAAVIGLENAVLGDSEITELESNDFMIASAVAYRGFWDWVACPIGFGFSTAVQVDVGGAIVGGLPGAGVASGVAVAGWAIGCFVDPPVWQW